MTRILLSDVNPELRGIVRFMPPLPFGSPLGRRVMQAALSLAPTPRIDGVRVDVVKDVALGLRVYVPHDRQSKGALLWIHGGGYITGRASMDHAFCGSTARTLGIVVAAIDYRLAPKHPFPAAIDDCMQAWHWLKHSADGLGIDPSAIAVGGQSAGGGLAASLAQRLHEMGDDAAAQWLFCPMLDDRTAAKKQLDQRRHFAWNNRLNAVGWRSYLNVEPGGHEMPAYSVPARREDLRALPPAWIGVGDVDLFHAECRSYADRLKSAGVAVVFEEVAGAPHAFEVWASKSRLARDYIAGAHEWLRQTLSKSASGT
jgi:acetyl esterase/lipase